MSHESPLITVIIPTYRRPQLLQKTIESVLGQTFSRFVICVYDDASGDETKSVVLDLMSRDSRVDYFCHPHNIGSAENFQFGLTRVQTLYFCFLSDDDLLIPDFFEIAMAQFHQFPEAGIFMGGLIYIDQMQRVKGLTLNEWCQEPLLSGNRFLEEYCRGTSFPLWTSMIFSLKVKEHVGRMNTQLMMPDSDFIIRAAMEFSSIISQVPCAFFRHHQGSISSSLKAETILEEMLYLSDLMMGSSSSAKQEEMNLAAYAVQIVRAVSVSILQHIAAGQFNKAEEGIQLLSLQPLPFKRRVLFLRLVWVAKRVPGVLFLFNIIISMRRAYTRWRTGRLLATKNNFKNQVLNENCC